MIKEVVDAVKSSIISLNEELAKKDAEIAKIQAEKDELVEDIFALEHFVKRHEVKVEQPVQELKEEEVATEVKEEVTNVVIG